MSHLLFLLILFDLKSFVCCGRHTLTWLPLSLFIIPCIIPLLCLRVGGTCYLLITNRIWKKWYDVTLVVYYIIKDSILLAEWLQSVCLPESLSAAAFEKAGCFPQLQVNELCQQPEGDSLPSQTSQWELSPGQQLDCDLAADSKAMFGLLTQRNWDIF